MSNISEAKSAVDVARSRGAAAWGNTSDDNIKLLAQAIPALCTAVEALIREVKSLERLR